MENYLLFSSFAFINLYNTLAKVVAPRPGSNYVFEGEIIKACSFCEEFLKKASVSLIAFKLLIIFKLLNAAWWNFLVFVVDKNFIRCDSCNIFTWQMKFVHMMKQCKKPKKTLLFQIIYILKRPATREILPLSMPLLIFNTSSQVLETGAKLHPGLYYVWLNVGLQFIILQSSGVVLENFWKNLWKIPQSPDLRKIGTLLQVFFKNVA